MLMEQFPAACFRERTTLREQQQASGTMAALRCLPCAAADLACSDMLGLSGARNVKD